MGGGHHDPPIKIPDYRIYKVNEDTPELLQVQRALKEQGLKDPWLRNEVWRYDRKLIGPQTWATRWGRVCFRKIHVGFALAAATVALEMGYDALMGKEAAGHGHH